MSQISHIRKSNPPADYDIMYEKFFDSDLKIIELNLLILDIKEDAQKSGRILLITQDDKNNIYEIVFPIIFKRAIQDLKVKDKIFLSGYIINLKKRNLVKPIMIEFDGIKIDLIKDRYDRLDRMKNRYRDRKK